MRDGQAGLVDHLVAVEQQVEVDRARPPALPALAAQLALDREEDVEQLPRRELGLERGDAVQEPRLVGDADRIRLAQGRDARRRPGSSAIAARIVAFAVAEVRAEADVRDASRARGAHGRERDGRVEHDIRLAHPDGDALDREARDAARRPERRREPRAGGRHAPSETSCTQAATSR